MKGLVVLEPEEGGGGKGKASASCSFIWRGLLDVVVIRVLDSDNNNKCCGSGAKQYCIGLVISSSSILGGTS